MLIRYCLEGESRNINRPRPNIYEGVISFEIVVDWLVSKKASNRRSNFGHAIEVVETNLFLEVL